MPSRQTILDTFIQRYPPGVFKEPSKQDGPKSAKARTTFRWYAHRLQKMGYHANATMHLWRRRKYLLDASGTATKYLEDFRRKHKQDLRLTAAVACSPEVIIDGMKDVGFAVPRSVISTGALRLALPPDIKGWLFTNGSAFTARNSSGIVTQVSSGPYAASFILGIPKASTNKNAFYYPVHLPGIVEFGTLVWPILNTYNLPPIQSVANSLSVSFGTQLVAASLPGACTTAAVSGYDRTVATLLGNSSATVSATGSYRGALGPVMNNPVNVKQTTKALTTLNKPGTYIIETGSNALAYVVPGSWTNGGDNTTAIGTGNTDIAMGTIQRPKPFTGTYDGSADVLPFIAPMGSAATLKLGVTAQYYYSGTSLSFMERLLTVTVNASVPYVDGAGNVSTSLVTVSSVQTMRVVLDRSESEAIPYTCYLAMELPAFTTKLDFVISASSQAASANATNATWRTCSVDLELVMYTPVLRPAFAITGLAETNATTINAVMNSVLVTESTPTNALLLGTNPVIPASEELLNDLEGAIPHGFSHRFAFMRENDPWVGIGVPHEVVRGEHLPVVSHAHESGTFLGPIVAALAPGLIAAGSKILPKAISWLGENVAPMIGSFGRQVMSGYQGGGGGAAGAPSPRYASSGRPDFEPPLLELIKLIMGHPALRGSAGKLKQVLDQLPDNTAMRFLDEAAAARVAADPKKSYKVLADVRKKPTPRKPKAEGAAARAAPSAGKNKGEKPPSAAQVMQALAAIEAPHKASMAVWNPPPPTPVRAVAPELPFSFLISGTIPPDGDYEITFADATAVMHNLDSNVIYTCPLNSIIPDSTLVCTVTVQSSILRCTETPAHATAVTVDNTFLRNLTAHPHFHSFGVGVRTNTDSLSGSLWLILATTEPVKVSLPGCTHSLPYTSVGLCNVDSRLLASFDQYEGAFEKAVENSPLYISAISSCDTSKTLHGAFGGSLLAPTLCAASGVGLDAVLTGAPFNDGRPTVADCIGEKQQLLSQFAAVPQSRRILAAAQPPSRLLPLATPVPDVTCPTPGAFGVHLLRVLSENGLLAAAA